jgi:pimeloyl-ACP methyl ester carboxylesterase
MPILSGLSSRVVAFSFRGRGLSSTPESGYDLNDHLSDMEAVVKATVLTEYCVLGFSRGASYALGWALGHQQDMLGLILVDQPPIHIRPGPGYVDFWSSLVYLDVPILNFMRKEALEGLARDALDVDFSSLLHKIRIPVKLFAGRNKEAMIPSDLSDEIIDLYKKEIPNFELVEFLHSGHMIPDEEQQKYLLEIDSFIASTAP